MDPNQIISLILSFAAFLVSLVSLYFSFYRPANLKLTFLKDDINLGGGIFRYGIGDQLRFRLNIYFENIGGAKATILYLKLEGYEYSGYYYKFNNFRLLSNLGDRMNLPVILADGDVFNVIGEMTFNNVLSFDSKTAVEIGKKVIEELNSFPDTFSITLKGKYRNGRGSEKYFGGKYEVCLNGKLKEMSKNIELELERLSMLN